MIKKDTKKDVAKYIYMSSKAGTTKIVNFESINSKLEQILEDLVILGRDVGRNVGRKSEGMEKILRNIILTKL